MVVGKIDVSLRELEKRACDLEKFITYSDSLVPISLRHMKSVIYNQRYLCCLLLRKSIQLKWDAKKKIIEEVMKELQIVGFTDILVEADTLLNSANLERVKQFWEEEGFHAVSVRNTKRVP